jgi:hypothetical protein
MMTPYFCVIPQFLASVFAFVFVCVGGGSLRLSLCVHTRSVTKRLPAHVQC